jgi:hypothetical protein
VPAGSGRPSGQWTSGDGADDSAADGQDGQPGNSPTPAVQGTQIADASSDWAQYLNPVGSAEAADASAPFNGLGPNQQHAQGVEVGKQALRNLGFEIVTQDAYEVSVPGFATPRYYDYIARDPVTGELVGVEVKTTQFSTIFFNPFQVEKDVAVGKSDGIDIPELHGKLTYIVYQAMCDGCEKLNFRTAYLLWRLTNARVVFQYFHQLWDAPQ